MQAMGNTLLAMLDLSAALDTVDHIILLKRVSKSLGINDHALRWFTSYLTEQFQSVHFAGKTSSSTQERYGATVFRKAPYSALYYFPCTLQTLVQSHPNITSIHTFSQTTRSFTCPAIRQTHNSYDHQLSSLSTRSPNGALPTNSS